MVDDFDPKTFCATSAERLRVERGLELHARVDHERRVELAGRRRVERVDRQEPEVRADVVARREIERARRDGRERVVADRLPFDGHVLGRVEELRARKIEQLDRRAAVLLESVVHALRLQRALELQRVDGLLQLRGLRRDDDASVRSVRDCHDATQITFGVRPRRSRRLAIAEKDVAVQRVLEIVPRDRGEGELVAVDHDDVVQALRHHVRPGVERRRAIRPGSARSIHVLDRPRAASGDQRTHRYKDDLAHVGPRLSVELLGGHVAGLADLLADAPVNRGGHHEDEEEQDRVLDHRRPALIPNELPKAP
jgi:hypothetical protein